MSHSLPTHHVSDTIKTANKAIASVWFGKNELGKFFDECGLKFFSFHECGGRGNPDMMKGRWGGRRGRSGGRRGQGGRRRGGREEELKRFREWGGCTCMESC